MSQYQNFNPPHHHTVDAQSFHFLFLLMNVFSCIIQLYFTAKIQGICLDDNNYGARHKTL